MPVRLLVLILSTQLLLVSSGCSKGSGAMDIGPLAGVETVSDCIAISGALDRPVQQVFGIWHNQDMSDNPEYTKLSVEDEWSGFLVKGTCNVKPFGESYFEVFRAGNLVLIFQYLKNPNIAVLLGEPASDVMAFCYNGKHLKELRTSLGLLDMSGRPLRVGVVEKHGGIKIMHLNWEVAADKERDKIVETTRRLTLYRTFPMNDLAEKRDDVKRKQESSWRNSRARSTLDLLELEECSGGRKPNYDLSGYWIDPDCKWDGVIRELFQEGPLVVSVVYLKPPLVFGSMYVEMYCAIGDELRLIFEPYRYPIGYKSGGCEVLPDRENIYRIEDEGTVLNRIGFRFFDVLGTCDIAEMEKYECLSGCNENWGPGYQKLYHIGTSEQGSGSRSSRHSVVQQPMRLLKGFSHALHRRPPAGSN